LDEPLQHTTICGILINIDMVLDSGRRMNRFKTLSTGTVTLIGSGEMSSSMSRVHRMVMESIDGPVQPFFIDTPAGFQLNVHQISDKARRYFRQHFNRDLQIASYPSNSLPPDQVEKALTGLKKANYIFAGPGSPSYAVKHWRGSPILNVLHDRLNSGAHLAFASAASIALGSYAVPVYEIYKVGDVPFWMEGLHFFQPFGFDPVIVPHWNNAEGKDHDTRFCFMGKSRMAPLIAKLPDDVVIFGIDEYTAVTLDFRQQSVQVVGAGSAFIRTQDQEMSFAAGSGFDIGLLANPANSGLPRAQPSLQEKTGVNEEPSKIWAGDIPEEGQIPSAFIDWLVALRSRFRKEKKWDLADELRNKLAEFGIGIEDGPTTTTWKRKPD
jgi:cyanophycinase-like exopeptidase